MISVLKFRGENPNRSPPLDFTFIEVPKSISRSFVKQLPILIPNSSVEKLFKNKK
jgi:hypothetical protein